MIGKNKDELKTHEFTSTEKFDSGVDTAENVLLVVAIIAIPFTGGTSLSVVAELAAKKMIKFTLKKSIKRTMRLMAIEARNKLRNPRNFLKNPNKYLKTKKREVMVRKGEKIVDKTGYGIEAISLVAMGTSILMGNNLEVKTICEEQE